MREPQRQREQQDRTRLMRAGNAEGHGEQQRCNPERDLEREYCEQKMARKTLPRRKRR